MKLSIEPISFTFKTPVTTAHGRVSERRGLRVSFETAGAVGRGEAMPWPQLGTESLEACQRALEQVTVSALPTSVDDVARTVATLKETPAAQSALEGALLEHLSRRRKVSITRLLGEPQTQSIQVNALIDGEDAEHLARAAKEAVEVGFTTLKVKVAARSLSADAQRLLAVRQAVGPNVRLRIDANGGWSESTARAALRGLDALHLELCEQPVTAGDVESLRRVRLAVPTCPIAADEVLLVAGSHARVLDAYPVPAAQILVLKPMALGGLLPALALARSAEAQGVACYVTTSFDGPLARAGAVALAGVLQSSSHGATSLAHGVSTVELFAGVAPDRFTPRQGAIRLFDEPGWGV